MEKQLFEFFRNYMINEENTHIDKDLKTLLKNEVNYSFNEDNEIEFISDDLEERFYNEYYEILNASVIRINFEVDDDCVIKHSRISSVEDKFFYSEYYPNDGGIDEVEEVFENNIIIKSYFNSAGFCFEDDAEILEILS